MGIEMQPRTVTREQPIRERLARIICAAFHDEQYSVATTGSRTAYIERWWQSHLPTVDAILAEMAED